MHSLTIIIFLAFSFVVCGQTPNYRPINKTQSKKNKTVNLDTSKTAIIPFDRKGNYPFDNIHKPAKLTQEDINIIDSLLIECVSDYNNSLDKEHKEWSITLNKHEYKKQLIAVTNKSGEKEVWVNCFCETSDNSWKSYIRLVDDGGNCFFNFKINLKTKLFYGLVVNDEA